MCTCNAFGHKVLLSLAPHKGLLEALCLWLEDFGFCLKNLRFFSL